MFVFELFRRPTKRGVNELEEDIFIVESFLKNKKMLLKHPCWVSEKTIQAIEKLISKNKEQEKIIELMAKDIAENKLDEDICRKVKNKTSEKDDCYGDDYDMCKDCVIEFYKKKASEENGNRNNN